jgi:hypothetical protein
VGVGVGVEGGEARQSSCHACRRDDTNTRAGFSLECCTMAVYAGLFMVAIRGLHSAQRKMPQVT